MIEGFPTNELVVDVVEPGVRRRKGVVACRIGQNIKFSLDVLESFSSRKWQSIIYDMFIVAAAVEFCDRSLARSTKNWGRRYFLSIPVHDPYRWTDKAVVKSLTDALNLLTGDDWHFSFRARRTPAEAPRQDRMIFPSNVAAVLAYSDGMDSCAVAELEGMRLGSQLLRIRVGGNQSDVSKRERAKIPFMALPYDVKLDSRRNAESSARSRGFKFSVVSAISAYLVDAPSAIVPESGQGALAPVLLPVAHSYEDYRSHPVFTVSMERFIYALLGYRISYEFPRIWYTKGETLKAFIDAVDGDPRWRATRSCWQQSRQVHVLGKRRQCGVCAACILRRLSVYAANLSESPETYVWESLSAPTWEKGAAATFKGHTKALREYSIAGVLHFKHLAELKDSPQYSLVKRHRASELSLSLRISSSDVERKLDRLLKMHASEWLQFTKELGPESFVRQWIDEVS